MAAPDALASLKIDRARPRPRKLWPWVAGGGALLLVVVAPQMAQHLQGVEVSAATVVKVLSLRELSAKGPSSQELSAAGYVVADRQAVLASKYTGRLAKLNVAEAQRVKKDELLAELDHHELDAQIENARAFQRMSVAEVERLKSEAAQMEADVAATSAPLGSLDAESEEVKVMWSDAQRRLERARNLVAKDAMPQTEVDDRITEVKTAEAKLETLKRRKVTVERLGDVAKARVQVARSAVTVAEARAVEADTRLRMLEATLTDYFVRSPFDGVVTEKAAELGEVVAPISIGGSMARGSIVTVADWDSLQAEVDVAEAYIERVKTGGRAAIKVDAFPGQTFPGRVRRILPRANRNKATVQVRVDLLKRAEGILPEMGVRVRFLPDDAPAGAETGEAKEKLALPRAAVQGDHPNAYVWILAGHEAHRRSVTLGERNEEWVEIAEGLSAGDQVVRAGAEKITKDGQKVRLTDEKGTK